MNFVAIDVETANADMASICQIGLAKVENGTLSEEWKTYVDPEDYFDGINVDIHGIDESVVKGAPTFPDLSDTLRAYVEGSVVVCHTHFDRVALHQAAQRYGVTAPECTWLDSAQVARRTWKECARRGYGLYDVCRMLGHDFKQHDALEDAKAAAPILLAAVRESGLDVEGWLRRVRQPIDPTARGSGAAIRREGNTEGALYGEVVVFHRGPRDTASRSSGSGSLHRMSGGIRGHKKDNNACSRGSGSEAARGSREECQA